MLSTDPAAARRASRDVRAARFAADFDRDFDADEIVDRCMLALINEGAKILDEGIAWRGSDIDVVYANGYGFPRYRGGPMFYADTLGLDAVVARLEAFSQLTGDPCWEVHPLLRQLADEAKTLGSLN